MSAFMMDMKVRDIQQAAYWKSKGYNFDPNIMTSFKMNQKVHDFERAAFWKERGTPSMRIRSQRS